MIAPLDVFRVEDRGTMWIDSAESLEHAVKLMVKLGAGEYLLFSQQTGHKDLYSVSRNGVAEFKERVSDALEAES